jgi:hypothetical protein
VEPTISRSTELTATPEAVWAIVTDLPKMGELSPENVGGRWIGDIHGPAVGARFRGVNRNGKREWWTRVRVMECERFRWFMFDVRSAFGMRVSRWAYEITPTADGCRLTEHWYRVGNKFVQRYLGPIVTGQADRPDFNAHSIEHTLAAVERRLAA